MNTAADKHCLFSEVKKSLPSQIFPFCFIGIFSATQASLIILSTLLFWRHTGYYYLTLNPAYPIGYLFFKSKEEGNTKSHCGEGSICLFWHEKSFFRIHLHLEVSSLWAFHLLYWLLLSCRKAFQGFNCRHPESVCASLIPKAPCDRGTVHLLSPGVTAQAQCAFSKALWGRSGASQVSVGCVCVGLDCPGLPKEWPEFICMFWSRARRFLLAQTLRSQSAPRDRMSEAEFINPLRVQLLVGSWEWEVFVCPKNSYPEERIIKAAPFGSVSKMASSSGYSW